MLLYQTQRNAPQTCESGAIVCNNYSISIIHAVGAAEWSPLTHQAKNCDNPLNRVVLLTRMNFRCFGGIFSEEIQNLRTFTWRSKLDQFVVGLVQLGLE